MKLRKRANGAVSRFARRQDGVAGILFALAAIPMIALAGGVIDYVYIQNEKSKLQNAADSAVLAAMKLDDPDDTEIRDTIVSYLQSNYKHSDRVQLKLNDLQVDVERIGDVLQRVYVSVPADVKTSFWGLVGIQRATFRVEAEATQGSGGLEVVMVLDNTGSMRGDKIEELRQAAEDLVNELKDMADNPQLVTVKVGLVPYASHVNVGTQYADAPWLDMSSCCNGYQWQGWVGSRPEPDDITDENYSVLPVPAVPNVVLSYDSDTGDTYLDDMPLNIQPIVPLQDLSDSSSVDSLVGTINSMEANGWTYIPAGLVWGWRVLSPQEPFTEGMDFDVAREKNVRKVVILMTDGSNTCHNTTQTVNGFENIRECGFRQDIQDDANDRMRQLCEAMHDEGILIASVAYEVTDNTAAADTIRELMEDCGNFGYYTPQQGELREVFRNIAKRLSKLHLSR